MACHVPDQIEEFRRGLDIGEKRCELPFDHLAADRLAVRGARTVKAHVVRVLLSGLALRPAGRQRLAAGALDEASQGKTLIEIGTGRNLGLAVQAFPDTLECLQTDQRLMLRLPQRHTPLGPLQIARIDDAGQDAIDVLVRDGAVPGLRELGEPLEKALHLRLCLEPTVPKAFHAFGDDGGQRLVAHQHLAFAGARFVAVSGRAGERPVAVHQPRPLAVIDLLRVLLALVLGDGRKKVLDKDRVGILAELDGRAFQPRPRL